MNFSSVLDNTTVFRTSEEVPHCHASTVEWDGDGNLWCCWFGGSWESHPDTAIWGSVRRDGKWSAAKVMAKLDHRSAHWNPVLFRRPDGRLDLYFRIGSSPSTWRTFRMTQVTSDRWDDVVAFGEYGGRGPVRNKPIILSNGHWLAPGSLEIPVYMERFSPPRQKWTAFIDRSEDEGVTWSATPDLLWPEGARKHGVIQPAVWETKDGEVKMLLRSDLGRVCAARSGDYGRTWTHIVTTDIPNPNSAIDVVKCGDLLVMAYNPVEGRWARRSPLSISFSRSPDGVAWSNPIDIESGDGSFSYPCLATHGDGKFLMTYSYGRRSIKMVEFEAHLDGESVATNLVPQKVDLPS